MVAGSEAGSARCRARSVAGKPPAWRRRRHLFTGDAQRPQTWRARRTASRSVGRNRWLKGRSSGSIFCRCGCRLGLAASVAERLSKHSVVGRRMRHGLRAAPIIAARSRRSSRAPVPRSLHLERTARFLSRWVSRLQCTICATRFVVRYPQNRFRLTAFACPVFRLELLQRCGKKTAVPVACLLVTNAPSMLITLVPPTRPHLT